MSLDLNDIFFVVKVKNQMLRVNCKVLQASGKKLTGDSEVGRFVLLMFKGFFLFGIYFDIFKI